MARPTDREELEYRKGVSDARGADGASGLLGVLIGAIVVIGLGAGAYFLFANQSQKSDAPNIINVPAPQAPSVKLEAPKTDVNISAPSPSLSVPGTSGGSNKSSGN